MRMVTRTIVSTVAKIRVFNNVTGLAEIKDITFPVDLKDTRAVEKASRKEFDGTDYTFIDVQEFKFDSAVYAMSEDEFISLGKKYNSRQEINAKKE